MTLLITGGMGHVGYEIARQAVAAGRDVLCLYRGGFREGEARALGPRAAWIACELTDAEAMRRLLAGRPIDACIHTAAVSNEAFARPNPLAAFAANAGATATLLDIARENAWRRFVLVSTGSVFQLRRDLVTPILEDEAPSPANIYSTTKAAAEMLVRMYRSQYGLSAASVRISWVYGPPVVSDSPTRGPIPAYVLRALRGEAIRDGGGDFSASFTHVADAAAGLIAAVAAPELRHDVYHLGHGRNFSAREAADAVRAAVPGATIELTGGTEPWTRYTALRAPLAGSRLREDTGFTCRVGLAEGIAEYVAWMRANPHFLPPGEGGRVVRQAHHEGCRMRDRTAEN